MKGSFFIKTKEANIITEKGVRAFIMESLLNSPFEHGAVFNVDDKTVQVNLEGDERQIKEFVHNLKKSVIEKFGNPTISFTDFKENPALEIPPLIKSSQALMVGQLQKGISVQLDILSGQKEIVSGQHSILNALERMSQEIKNLPQELAKALKHN